MEEIEYLEEYEDLILPAISTSTSSTQRVCSSRLSTMATNPQLPDEEDSSSIDQDIFESLFDDNSDDDNMLPKKLDSKFSERRDEHASLDSLDMLVKDLGEQITHSTATASKPASGQNDCAVSASTSGHIKSAPKVLQSKPNTIGTSSARPKALTAGTKIEYAHHNNPKSIATVRPTVQSQKQKRFSLTKPTLCRSTLPTSRSANMTVSSSTRTNDSARTQISTITSSTKKTTGGASRARVTQTTLSRKVGVTQNKSTNRKSPTIIKPEKTTVCKDPAEDPLKLENDNADNDSDSTDLYSDISDDSFVSSSDLSDIHEDLDAAKKSASAQQVSLKSSASPLAAAATTAATASTKDRKNKLNEFMSHETTVLQTSTAMEPSVLEITKNLPEKVTIISDTILTRIDTAFLQSISCKNDDIQNEDEKVLNRNQKNCVQDGGNKLESICSVEDTKPKDKTEENSKELDDLNPKALKHMSSVTEHVENVKEFRNITPKLESNANTQALLNRAPEINTKTSELPRMSPDLENVGNVEEVAMHCNIEDFPSSNEEQRHGNSTSEGDVQAKTIVDNIETKTEAERKSTEESQKVDNLLIEHENDKCNEDRNVINKKEEEKGYERKVNLEDKDQDFSLNNKEDKNDIANKKAEECGNMKNSAVESWEKSYALENKAEELILNDVKTREKNNCGNNDSVKDKEEDLNSTNVGKKEEDNKEKDNVAVKNEMISSYNEIRKEEKDEGNDKNDNVADESDGLSVKVWEPPGIMTKMKPDDQLNESKMKVFKEKKQEIKTKLFNIKGRCSYRKTKKEDESHTESLQDKIEKQGIDSDQTMENKKVPDEDNNKKESEELKDNISMLYEADKGDKRSREIEDDADTTDISSQEMKEKGSLSTKSGKKKNALFDIEKKHGVSIEEKEFLEIIETADRSVSETKDPRSDKQKIKYQITKRENRAGEIKETNVEIRDENKVSISYENGIKKSEEEPRSNEKVAKENIATSTKHLKLKGIKEDTLSAEAEVTKDQMKCPETPEQKEFDNGVEDVVSKLLLGKVNAASKANAPKSLLAKPKTISKRRNQWVDDEIPQSSAVHKEKVANPTVNATLEENKSSAEGKQNETKYIKRQEVEEKKQSKETKTGNVVRNDKKCVAEKRNLRAKNAEVKEQLNESVTAKKENFDENEVEETKIQNKEELTKSAESTMLSIETRNNNNKQNEQAENTNKASTSDKRAPITQTSKVAEATKQNTEKASVKTAESPEIDTTVCEKLEAASVSDEKDDMKRRSLRKRCADSPLPINDAAKQLFKEPLSLSTTSRNKETLLSVEISPHNSKRSLRSPHTAEQAEDNGPANKMIKSDYKRKSERLRNVDNSELVSDTSESETEEYKRFKADAIKQTHRHLVRSPNTIKPEIKNDSDTQKTSSVKLLDEQMLKAREQKTKEFKELSNKKRDASVAAVKAAQNRSVAGTIKSNITLNADGEPACKVARIELQKEDQANKAIPKATTKSKERTCNTSPEKKQTNATKITDKLQSDSKQSQSTNDTKLPTTQRKNLRLNIVEEEETAHTRDMNMKRKSLRSNQMPEISTVEIATYQKKVDDGTSKEIRVAKTDMRTLGKTAPTTESENKPKTGKLTEHKTTAGELESTNKPHTSGAPQRANATKNTKPPSAVMTFNEWLNRQKTEKDTSKESADTSSCSEPNKQVLPKSPSTYQQANESIAYLAESEVMKKDKSVELDKTRSVHSGSVRTTASKSTPTKAMDDKISPEQLAIEKVSDNQVLEEKTKQPITKKSNEMSGGGREDDVNKSNVADIGTTSATVDQAVTNKHKQLETIPNETELTTATEKLQMSVDKLKQSEAAEAENKQPITEPTKENAYKLQQSSAKPQTSTIEGSKVAAVETAADQLNSTKGKAQSKKKKPSKVPYDMHSKEKVKTAKPYKRSEIEVLLDSMPKEMKESANLELLLRDNNVRMLTKRKLANSIANPAVAATTNTLKAPPDPASADLAQACGNNAEPQHKKLPKSKKHNGEKLVSKDLLAHCRKFRVRINRSVVSTYLKKLHMPPVLKKKRKTTTPLTVDNRRFKLQAPATTAFTHGTRASSRTPAPVKVLSVALPCVNAAVPTSLNKSLPIQLAPPTKSSNTAAVALTAPALAEQPSQLEQFKCATPLEISVRATVAGRANVLTIPPQNRRPPPTAPVTRATILVTPKTTPNFYTKQTQNNTDDNELESPSSTTALLDGESDMGNFLLTPMKSMPVNETNAPPTRKQAKRLPTQKEKMQANARSAPNVTQQQSPATGEHVLPLAALSVPTAAAVLATSAYADVKEELDEALSARAKSPTTITSDGVAAALSFTHGSNGTAFGVTPTTIDTNGTRMYSFLHPAKYNRSHGNVMLDFCCPNLDGPMPAIDPTRIHAQLQSAVRELPAYIVMTTKLITRADLQANKNAIPASIRQKVEKITASSGSGKTTFAAATMASIAGVVGEAAPGAVVVAGSGAALLPLTVSALQKHLPPNTTITPKVLPPNSAAVAVTTPNTGLPPLTPFSAFSSAHHLPSTLLTDAQRNLLRSNLRRFDAILKKYYHRVAVLTFADRQRILENIINANSATSVGAYNFMPKDVEIAIRVLEAYAQHMSALSSPSAVFTTSASLSTATDFNTVPSNVHSRIVKKNTNAGASVSVGSSITPTCTRKLHVPIYDEERNVIGWRLQVSGATTAVSATSSAVTKTTMSTRSDIMSTTSQTLPYTSKRVIAPVQNADIRITTASTLRQPAQDSPRIFYTKPPLQTSTPIAGGASSTALVTTGAAAAGAALSPADSTFFRKNVTRLGRSITLRKLTSSTISATTTTPPVSHTPNLNKRTAHISITVSKTKTSTSCVTRKSGETSTTEQHTSMRMTRKSAAAAAASSNVTAPSAAPKIIVINKDISGNNLPSTDECILPDNAGSSVPNTEIKREQLDGDFIGGN